MIYTVSYFCIKYFFRLIFTEIFSLYVPQLLCQFLCLSIRSMITSTIN